MGAVNETLPQGPEVHCGEPGYHSKHGTMHEGHVYTWCSGVPVLPGFVELTVRVPMELALLVPTEEMAHRQVVNTLMIKGLASAVLDNIDHPDTRRVLRVRAGGEDKFYQLAVRDE